MLNLECRILDVECIKFGRQSLRNSEPASAGDISIAMGWSSTVRVGVDRKADEVPQSGETPRTNKNILEPVEWVTEALAVMTSNDFLSPGSRPSVNAEVSPRQDAEAGRE